MNDLIVAPKRLIKPDPVRVIAVPRPFSVISIEKIVPHGGTIAEILHSVSIFPPAWTETYVLINDLPVPREYWEKVKPKSGTDLVVRVMPRGTGGGGKAALRIIIAIAGALAGAAFLGPALTGGPERIHGGFCWIRRRRSGGYSCCDRTNSSTAATPARAVGD